MTSGGFSSCGKSPSSGSKPLPLFALFSQKTQPFAIFHSKWCPFSSVCPSSRQKKGKKIVFASNTWTRDYDLLYLDELDV